MHFIAFFVVCLNKGINESIGFVRFNCCYFINAVLLYCVEECGRFLCGGIVSIYVVCCVYLLNIIQLYDVKYPKQTYRCSRLLSWLISITIVFVLYARVKHHSEQSLGHFYSYTRHIYVLTCVTLTKTMITLALDNVAHRSDPWDTLLEITTDHYCVLR